jgi:hypothetical protein
MDQTEQLRSVVSWMISGGALVENEAYGRERNPVRARVGRATFPIRDRLGAAIARIAPTRTEPHPAAECVAC